MKRIDEYDVVIASYGAQAPVDPPFVEGDLPPWQVMAPHFITGANWTTVSEDISRALYEP